MDKLDNHNKIAIDFDGTLIDGTASASLGQYIKQNPDKSFYIVTFRTPEQAATIPEELQENGLNIAMFERIVPLPPRLLLDFDEDQRFRRTSSMPSLDKASQNDLLPGEYKFMHWKGFIARKLGATVLIDDMPNLAVMGCQKFGVALIDVGHLG